MVLLIYSAFENKTWVEKDLLFFILTQQLKQEQNLFGHFRDLREKLLGKSLIYLIFVF